MYRLLEPGEILMDGDEWWNDSHYDWYPCQDVGKTVPDFIIYRRKVSQARLTLARELIAALTNNGLLSPRLMTPETKTLWERWQAEEGKP